MIPQITLSPETDGNTKFILVEAGDSYEDKTGYFWDTSVVNESSVKSAELGDPAGVQTTFLTKADDAVDGTITTSIDRTIKYLSTDQDDQNLTASGFSESQISDLIHTSAAHLNHRYQITYSVKDSQGNEADQKHRYLWVKDTRPQV